MRLGCGGLLLGAHWLVGGRALVRGEWLTGGLSAMHALRMGGVLPLDEEAENPPIVLLFFFASYCRKQSGFYVAISNDIYGLMVLLSGPSWRSGRNCFREMPCRSPTV